MQIAKNSDGTYILTPTPLETTVIAWAIRRHGADVLRQLLENWLSDRASLLASERGVTIRDAYDAATPAVKAQIKSALNLTD